ncbi:MAG TPA: DNA-protecting protein DprA [Polyangiaceae bacterium]|nr:DNA-protecting protein DprA [Polyangiaceae bacterium]
MGEDRTYRALDHDYPYLLRELRSPPDPLCVRGDLLAGPAVAIVGTRRPSDESVVYTEGLARRLVERGVAVWSGGAVGIDAAAHRGALQAGGRTVVVVPTGLDRCYPPEHAELYEIVVASGGAIVSSFERRQLAQRHTFHQRNAVLAALTQATVVIEAPIRSGARSTAKHARRLRRPLFIVPTAPWEGRGKGNLIEIGLGGRPLVDEGLLFAALGVPQTGSITMAKGAREARPSSGDSPPKGLSDAGKIVFRAISSTPRHPDDLCAETGLPTALVQEALLTLVFEAVLVEGPAGWFRRVNF